MWTRQDSTDVGLEPGRTRHNIPCKQFAALQVASVGMLICAEYVQHEVIGWL